MEKFIPYEKLSKKQQRALDAQNRGSWGGLNPVTRRPDNPKAYNRKKTRKWESLSPITVSFDYCGPLSSSRPRFKEACA